MRHTIWPTVRTIGIGLLLAMLPAIYVQNHQDAKDHEMQYLTLLSEMSDLKIITLSRFATTDQEYKDLDYRMTQVERRR